MSGKLGTKQNNKISESGNSAEEGQISPELLFSSYVTSKLMTLCALIIALIFISMLLLTAQVEITYILIMAGGFTLITVAWLIFDYMLKRKRLNRLQRIINDLPEKYLAGELIGFPSDAVEQEYFFLMKEVSHSAIGEVEKARREKQDYCEYVESFVHEIKTPLTACSLILANDGDTHKLKREIKRADNQTENILYYARLRSSDRDVRITRVNVREIIDNALRNEMELLIAAAISVNVEGGFTANTDPKLLEFILKQLLSNCAKYCTGCKISIQANEDSIAVEDNGCGIPAHELPRVTQRGFTGEKWRTGRGSTGMGLYIVSELCNKLGIELNIESEINTYTRFTFTFR